MDKTEYITSRSNPKIKNIAKLISSSSARREQGLFVVEGLRLCEDAHLSGAKIDTLVYTAAAEKKGDNTIRNIAAAAEHIIVTDDDVFIKISETVNPQGVLCVVKMGENDDNTIKPDGKYIVLCSLANPDNVGAIARSAEAFGLDGMVIVGGCDIYNPKALRASMGALLRIKTVCCDAEKMFLMMKNAGVRTFASTPRESATPMDECDFSDGVAVLIGNEANGLDDDIIARCDSTLTIKMKGRAESLNAAAAAAVIIYQMSK